LVGPCSVVKIKFPSNVSQLFFSCKKLNVEEQGDNHYKLKGELSVTNCHFHTGCLPQLTHHYLITNKIVYCQTYESHFPHKQKEILTFSPGVVQFTIILFLCCLCVSNTHYKLWKSLPITSSGVKHSKSQRMRELVALHTYKRTLTIIITTNTFPHYKWYRKKKLTSRPIIIIMMII
jgi:hypothetical protein